MKFDIISKVGAKIGPKAGLAILKVKKASPEILLGVGIASGIACVVYACKGTLKMEAVMDKHKNAIEEVHKNCEIEDGVEVIDKEAKREITKIYVETGMELAKLYLPSVAFGALSMGCIAGSHSIMTNRIAGLTAAYTAIDEAFRDYRKRVVSKYGEEEDYNLRYGVETVAEGKVVKDGKEENIYSKKYDLTGHSQYAKFFDQSCSSWDKDPTYNRLFLQQLENTFTDKLMRRGYVFLNEVYEALGIEPTPAGQVVGWLKDAGDNYVSFGIFDKEDEAARRFVNGLENVVLLDFNVDGVIYDKI